MTIKIVESSNADLTRLGILMALATRMQDLEADLEAVALHIATLCKQDGIVLAVEG